MESKVQLANKMVRFMNLFPHDGEDDLVVLKGHLLIEELLSEWVQLALDKSTCPVGIHVTDRTSFHHKLTVGWCLLGNDMEEYVWISLKLLNEIRNKMAHRVVPAGVEEMKEELINVLLPRSPYEERDYGGKELVHSISWLYVSVGHYLHEWKNKNS